MRLLLGTLTIILFVWTSGATYWYVCEKRGLCSEVRLELDKLAEISRAHLNEIEQANKSSVQSSVMPSFFLSESKGKKETPALLSMKTNVSLVGTSPVTLPQRNEHITLCFDDLFKAMIETADIVAENVGPEKQTIAVTQLPEAFEKPKPVITEAPLSKAKAAISSELKPSTEPLSKKTIPKAEVAITKTKTNPKPTKLKGEGFYAVVGMYGDKAKAEKRLEALNQKGVKATLLPHVAGLSKVAIFLDENAEIAKSMLVEIRENVFGRSNLYYYNPVQ